MSLIRGKDTRPEMDVRKFLHGHGFRYVLHRKDLPGKPDIVLPKWKTVIFVNGCYWHRHENCKLATVPKTNTAFWEKKFSENVKRDSLNYQLLTENGWNVIIVWECEIRNGSFKNYLLNQIHDGL
jgi:DNA mismatch endonuclease (patch repair protein)